MWKHKAMASRRYVPFVSSCKKNQRRDSATPSSPKRLHVERRQRDERRMRGRRWGSRATSAPPGYPSYTFAINVLRQAAGYFLTHIFSTVFYSLHQVSISSGKKDEGSVPIFSPSICRPSSSVTRKLIYRCVQNVMRGLHNPGTWHVHMAWEKYITA